MPELSCVEHLRVREQARLEGCSAHMLPDCVSCAPACNAWLSPTRRVPLAAGDTFLSQLLLQRLCESFAGPVLLWPLAAARAGDANGAVAAPAVEGDAAWRQSAGSLGASTIIIHERHT